MRRMLKGADSNNSATFPDAVLLLLLLYVITSAAAKN